MPIACSGVSGIAPLAELVRSTTGLNEAQAKLELQTTSLKIEMDRSMESVTAELNGHVEKRVTALKRQLDSSAEELKSTMTAISCVASLSTSTTMSGVNVVQRL